MKPAQISKSSSYRRVKGLCWAELRSSGPFTPIKPRASSLKRGLAYERKVGKNLLRMASEGKFESLINVHLNQWILFADSNGIYWAQPDAYIHMDDRMLLIEAKLTQTDSVEPQLLQLYLPLLRSIYNLPILCLQVCKNLRYIPKKFVESPQELLKNPGPGVYTWHLR